MQDAAEAITVIAPDGQEIIVELEKSDGGLFEGLLETDQIGLFEISDAEMTTLAHVGPVDAPEFRDMISTASLITPIIETNGGTARRLLNSSRNLNVPNILPVRSKNEAFGRDWLGFVQTGETELRGINRQGLFSGFLGLALLLMAISSMWYREGR